MNCHLITPFKTWFSFILANIVIGFVIALLSVHNWSLSSITLGTIWGATISFTQWIGQVWIQSKIEDRYSWFEKPTLRFIWTFISIIVYSIAAYLLVSSIISLIIFGEIPWYIYTVNKFWLIPVIVSLFISITAGSIGFFTGWRASLIEQEQLKSEMLNYKYEALKNQINPHFMFNSLNVLSELVHEDQDLAVKYIHQFSDMYRYVLESKDHELRPLAEELAFLEKYIFLLEIRFEDKLKVNLNLKDVEDDLIVPVAMQLLVENAVKHNEVSRANPLTVNIKKDGDWIIVENKIQAKISREHSSKIGLKNLEQQYAFFNRKIIVNESEGHFTVKIPVIKVEE